MDQWDEGICPTDWHVAFDEAVQKSAIKKADRIEELAEALELDPTKLKKTVDTWNGYCADGEDPEFGQEEPYLIPVLDPPFYGAAEGGQLFATGCGLRVNTQMQVRDTNGDVIPGLYAAYQTAGGFAGQGRIGQSVISNCGLAYTTGMIAAENATLENV